MALTKVSGSILKDPLNLGEVSIGGTLTYQDVTNVDALGIGTFRAGINVSGGQLDVGSNIKLGNAGVVTCTGLDVNGDADVDGHTELDNVNIAGIVTVSSDGINAGILNIKTGNNLRLRFSSGGTAQFRGDTDPIASFDRGSANSTNVKWGYLGADRGIISSISNEFRITASGTIPMTFHSNGSERLRIDSAGRVGLGTIAPSSFHANADNFVIMGDNAHVGMTLMTTNGGLDSTIAFADGTSGGTELQGAVIYQHNGDIMRFLVNQSERLRITSQGAIGLGGANYGTSGQVLTSGGSSGATTWSTISGTTINGNTDDYIITASGTANTLNGESNLIFTGSRLGINPSGGSITDIPATSHDTVVIGNSSATAGGITLEGASGSGNLAYQMYKQGGQPCARFMYEHSSNSVRFDSATGGSPGSGEALRMRLHPDGDVEIADGDLIIGTSGHGIDFGATANGGTGTPNEIFDDYEEGSWTPAIEGLSNTPSFHNLGGNYTKIGNRVFLQCHIQINGSNKPQFSNQSAAFKISGLPFTGQGVAGGGYFGAHGVCVWQQLQWVGSSYSSYGHNDDTQLSPGIVDGGTRISLQTCGQGIYYTGQLLNRALHNNYAPNIEFDMSYRTAT